MPTMQEDLASWSGTEPTPIRLSDPMRSADKPQSLSDARPIPRTADARSPSRFSRDRAAGATTQKNCTLSYGLRARRPEPLRRGLNPRYACAVRSNLISGSKPPREERPLCRPGATISDFHASRCGKRMRTYSEDVERRLERPGARLAG